MMKRIDTLTLRHLAEESVVYDQPLETAFVDKYADPDGLHIAVPKDDAITLAVYEIIVLIKMKGSERPFRVEMKVSHEVYRSLNDFSFASVA